MNINPNWIFNAFLDALDGSYCTYFGGDAPYIGPICLNPAPGGYKDPLQCGEAPTRIVLSFSYIQIEAALQNPTMLGNAMSG